MEAAPVHIAEREALEQVAENRYAQFGTQQFAPLGTDADKSFYSSPVNGKFLGKTALVLGVKVNF